MRPATDSAQQATAAAPVVLGRYRLVRRLGAGGFGSVWQARDERLERDVAVKILPRERVLGGRFEREAHAAARLSHPGIVTLYEAAADEDGAYLVSELVRGETLDDLLEAGRLSDRDIVTIGIALCDALRYAHGQGVVHRDVKPSNVLVPDAPATGAQPAKLTDFGVARVVGVDALTRSGDVIGTAAYMSPEQAEGRDAGAPSDLFSVAVVLYEALTGVNPVQTRAAGRHYNRLGEHLPPLRRQRRDLPRELGRAIDAALRPRPSERGSVEALRRTLALVAPQMSDGPLVVEGGWTEKPDRATGANQEASPESEPEFDLDLDPPRGTTPQARAAAALATAAIAAWLAAHTLAPAHVAPAIAGLVAALVVAAFPRLGWAILGAATATLLVVHGLDGGALLALIAMLVPLALLPVSRADWPLPALAPVLGFLGVAGAWPALAGRAGTFWRRAALGAAGWLWLLVAAQFAGADLYAKRPSGTPPATVWLPSLYETAHHVLLPLISTGLAAAALVWALAAAILPTVSRGGPIRRELPIVVVWAAATALASAAAITLAGGSTNTIATAPAIVGAAAAAMVALAPAIARAPA
jgi:hypothetical protein